MEPSQSFRPETELLSADSSRASPRDRPSVDLAPGAGFESYEILERVGRGAMGVVYRARNTALDRIVALKILLPSRAGEAPLLERFVAEARILARLDHHNLVAIYRVGRHDDLDFIEMEFVAGSLDERLGRGPLEIDEACRVAEQVARALSRAHELGVIHRDVKPANVLLTADGIAKLGDFGLAKDTRLDVGLTAPGLVLGSPLYMAPEQWRGDWADERTDLYGLGATLYHALTGAPPFDGGMAEQMEKHLHVAPRSVGQLRPETPRPLVRLVDRLLAKDPSERPSSALDVIAEIRSLDAVGGSRTSASSERPVEAAPSRPSPPVAPRRPLGSSVRSRRTVAVACAACAIVAAAASLAAHAAGGLDWLELRTVDARFAWTRGAAGPSPVVVVLADRESKEKLSPDRPFSRKEHHATLLARLADAGARAVGVDLLFVDRSRGADDVALAEATRWTPGIVHAVHLMLGTAPGPGRTGGDLQDRWSLAVSGDGLPSASGAEVPIEPLASATSTVGHVSLALDRDGVIRRVPLLIDCRGRVIPSLSLAVAMRALGTTGVERRAGEVILRAGDGRTTVIPVDSACRMAINFRFRDRELRAIPLWRAMESDGFGRPTAESVAALRGSVALIGSEIAGDQDSGALPGDPLAPLVWGHAFAVDTILDGSFVVRPAGSWTVAVVLAGALLAAAAFAFLRPWWAAAASIGLLSIHVGVAFLAFGGRTRLELPVAAPALAMGATSVACLALRLGRAERDRRRAAGVLSRYLSPAVTARVLSDPDGPRLGGKRAELTIVAARLEDFDELSERLEPEEVDELLGGLLEVLTEVVFRHEGTVSQVSGRGLLAFFGDPLPQPDHAARGVRCALEAMDRSRQVIAAWSGAVRRPVRLGIGVHTGYVAVGNVGSLRSMAYTVLGRNVAIAEELARHAPGKVAVSGRAASLAGGAAAFEDLGSCGSTRCLEPLRRVAGG